MKIDWISLFFAIVLGYGVVFVLIGLLSPMTSLRDKLAYWFISTITTIIAYFALKDEEME